MTSGRRGDDTYAMYQSGFQELLGEFLLEARERADEVEALLLRLRSGDAEAVQTALAQAKRELHTLKGNSGMMGFSELQQLTHRMEDRVEDLDLETPDLTGLLGDLDELRRGLETIGNTVTDAVAAEEEVAPASPDEAAKVEEPTVTSWETAGSVRVPFSKIDQLVELQAETLIFRNRLLDAIHQGQALLSTNAPQQGDFLHRLASAWEEVEIAQQALGKTLNLLQEQVMDLSLVPLQGLFRSLRRVVHDESVREGKKVELEIYGGETPIDKTLLETAAEALGHLVRNAVNHGIESPEDRLRAGKSEVGVVRLRGTLEGNQVWIEVSDDGAGIDTSDLKEQIGLTPSPHEEDEFAFLFEEGVSSRKSADLGAGRGVGLSAVKKTVERQSGRIEVRSEPGEGTSFALRLPVTASILRSLVVQTDGEDYAIPLAAVTETLRTDPAQVHRVNHSRVLRWRGRVVSVLDLGETFETAEAGDRDGFLVIIEVNGRYRALAIDEIAGIHDIVVKGLDHIVGTPTGISGSTILGDGRVIMILDPAALANLSPSLGAHER